MTEERAQAAADPILPVYAIMAVVVGYVGWEVAGWIGVAMALALMVLLPIAAKKTKSAIGGSEKK